MSEKEYAFPKTHTSNFGMTLRDYFAGQALPEAMRITIRLSEDQTGKAETFAAGMAYEMADAMLEARKQ